MERFFLRKRGTKEVFAWTPALAKRADMVAITEREAEKVNEEKAIAQKARATVAQTQQKNAEAAAMKKLAAQRKALSEGQDAEDVDDVDLPPLAGEGEKDSIEDMDREALLLKASEFKLAVAENWKDDTIRKHIRAAMEAVSAAETVGNE